MSLNYQVESPSENRGIINKWKGSQAPGNLDREKTELWSPCWSNLQKGEENLHTLTQVSKYMSISQRNVAI